MIYTQGSAIFVPGMCLRRPKTFLKKGFWTSKNFLKAWNPSVRAQPYTERFQAKTNPQKLLIQGQSTLQSFRQPTPFISLPFTLFRFAQARRFQRRSREILRPHPLRIPAFSWIIHFPVGWHEFCIRKNGTKNEKTTNLKKGGSK
jgi:hypothetical protein